MKRLNIKTLLLTSIFSVLVLLMVTCKKSETNTTTLDITVIAYDDHIELSWNSFGNANYYVITDDFCIVDENNHQTDSTYNVLITETSQNNYVDLHPFAGMNHYKVTAVNENGSNEYKEISCYFSEGNPQILIYPNPASSEFHLSAYNEREVPEGESISINHITIETLQGQVVYDINVDGEEFTINTSQYDNGIYLAHVNTDSGELVKRFVIAHD